MSRVVAPGRIRRPMPRERQRRPDGRPLGDLMLRPGERPSERRPLVTDDHQPVMVEEVLHFLAPVPGGTYVDATVGAGGHAEAILRHVHSTRLIGIDRDPVALRRASFNLQRFGDRVVLERGDFGDLGELLARRGIERIDGLFLDLGMSSMQVDDPGRGFSFRLQGPLDMRMDPSEELTAAEVVNRYPERELARILWEYGEERHSRRIAKAIVESRRRAPIRTTTELAAIVTEAYPGPGRRRGHPARLTFQALRIEVNRELRVLAEVLRQAPALLRPGGRTVVLSYHSLEDRMVKRAFADLAGRPSPLPGLPPPPGEEPTLRVLTRGAILPSETEVQRNPRASSARLRAAERLGGEAS